jgi:TonB family protein
MRFRLFGSATIAATIMAGVAGSLSAADPELISLAPPNSQVMWGVNVEQVILSPLRQLVAQQSGIFSDTRLQRIMEAGGFNPMRDLREILVTWSGLPGDESSITLVRGTFDIPKIMEAATAAGSTVETYKGVPVVRQSAQDSLAFPDSSMAIMGGDAGVRAAIDRKSAPAAISAALAVKVNQLSSTEDAWFVSMAPLAQSQGPPPGAAGSNEPAGLLKILNKVQQSSGGIKLGANVTVSLQAVSATDQDAATVAAALKSLVAAVTLMDNAKSPPFAQMAALLQNVNITPDGKVTTITLSVPEAAIKLAFEALHPQVGSIEIAPHSRASVAPQPNPMASSAATGPAPQRIRVARDVQKTKLLQHATPIYPPLALQARIAGVVKLNVIIATDGTVRNVTLMSGHPLLVNPAMEAVRQWVYEPTLLNGQPVEVVTLVEVDFSMTP